MAEGSIWEALDKASYYRLEQSRRDRRHQPPRPARRDRSGLGPGRLRAPSARPSVPSPSPSTATTWSRSMTRSAGHRRARSPTVIFAKTIKGKGFSEIENKRLARQSRCRLTWPTRAIAELGGRASPHCSRPSPSRPEVTRPTAEAEPNTVVRTYTIGDAVATRKAYGDALVASRRGTPSVVVLDGEVSNSTSPSIRTGYPERYFEMFIAEQQLVASATGLAARGTSPSPPRSQPSSHGPTTSSAWARSRVDLCCRLARGVEIGADGPSQMALEDLAKCAPSTAPPSLPPDATEHAALVGRCRTKGISYLRTTRGAYPVLYPPNE